MRIILFYGNVAGCVTMWLNIFVTNFLIMSKLGEIIMRQQVLDGFISTFGASGAEPRVFFSPGRVNLIGEHIDYNGGLVMPCALNLGTYGAIRKRGDKIVKLVSGNFDSHVSFNLEKLVNNAQHGWGNYPKGVVAEILKAGHEIRGFEMYIMGSLPNGAGLSSSASINTLVAMALNSVFELNIPPVDRAILCQMAERFCGVSCGIMDPFACTMGKKDHAILLDCNTLKYSYAPLNLGDYHILIANTNYKRGLADSKYNERLAECEAALAELKKVCDIGALCELSPEEFEKHKNAITNETHRKRAEHAVYENFRTKEAARVLKAGRLGELAPLMAESHLSLRNLYEVVGDALDAMFEPSVAFEGILGTRMTGAGFGGCTVTIVHKDDAGDFIRHVGDAYLKKTGIHASFYIAEVADGACEI